jgi:3-deoxy-D-manno-octulosonate 8-phosphate phosphatase (KDO 8-P phosphatase)
VNDVHEDRLASILAAFRDAGGRFIVPIEEIAQKIGDCRALIFDWDGVFNAGRKGQAATSDFSEADSMGTNMLRYGLWRKLGALPYTAIVSGEDNDTAIDFARREHFTEVYTGVRDKRLVTDHVCSREGLSPQQIACVFDDINDLPMAGMCGLRLMVRRNASPLLADYVARRSLCDYVSGAASGEYAVREICELLLGLLGNFDPVLDSRIAFDGEYQTYLQNRQSVVTGRFDKGGPEKPE